MGDAEDEDLSHETIEQQLEDHLQEHKLSLYALEEALACDPQNEELLEVYHELSTALKSAEESLLQLKRNRLLHEIDDVLNARASESAKNAKGTSEVSGVAITETIENREELKSLPSEALAINSIFMVGSKCRFRYSDGRWYNGHIIGLENKGLARISFLTPTTEKMQICKFYAEHRCRFGENCRMSHGYVVPLDALKPFKLPILKAPCIGSVVLASHSSNGEGIWRSAEIESWNNDLGRGKAVFVDDGSCLEVGIENLCSSEYAQVSDLESSSTSDDNEDEDQDDEDEEDTQEAEEYDDISDFSGLGSKDLMKVNSPMENNTQVFAKWEKHTRGMASKIMLSMGYREGMGLGRSGQGIVVPIQARILPKGQSLDFIGKEESNQIEGKKMKKKSSRGGKRKRDKKFAEAARLARLGSEEESSLDVFGFINNQLSAQKGEEDSLGTSLNGEKVGSNRRQGKVKTQHKDTRKSLMAQADGVAEIKNRVEKLEEMALRNRKDKAVYDAVSRKLDEARRDLRAAEANHASASFAVHSEEKEKKWLKF